MNSPSDGHLELCDPREWTCGVPSQAEVRFPLGGYKALAGGPVDCSASLQARSASLAFLRK